jgi:uncharacterized spore protein YtfJ
MDVKETFEAARGSLTVPRVYGEPYERNGVTVIPAASVQGGAGGGSGEEPDCWSCARSGAHADARALPQGAATRPGFP